MTRTDKGFNAQGLEQAFLRLKFDKTVVFVNTLSVPYLLQFLSLNNIANKSWLSDRDLQILHSLHRSQETSGSLL